ncbi:3'(2'),5'-bisphosphate nucleotidase CysQ [Polycladidibacter stylochi]|uniref:3'(2'),5'-bisphosphate nucleotidase CysQ n=1 Tax=Polycladidibacter stylochi TaxID=1807766 RepID=UPI00082DCF29|nr:3'(2'),5'-bisphosphate nucleotidase CysQ [Pseudovibrio stylochi]
MIEQLKKASLQAGEKIMAIYNSGFSEHIKQDGSPVTIADQAAEEIILKHLADHFPTIPVIAEEAMASGIQPNVADRYFLVDPLDGTREFIKRNGEFTVNIALVENGIPTKGVVYAPALTTLYYGELNVGAFRQLVDIKGATAEPIRVRRAPLDKIAALVSRSHLSEKTKQLLNKMPECEKQSTGSSLKFCRLAEGLADFYPRFSPTMQWDTAAGHAVLLAAGGAMVKTDGSPFLYEGAKITKNKAYENPYFFAVGDEKIISRYGLTKEF